MELPNKKIWSNYYKTVSRQMSFEKIYVPHVTIQHLKVESDTLMDLLSETSSAEGVRSNIAQFTEDVELVFSNAMQFNTPPWEWEAARQLKVPISFFS
jgi:hypothetical protein